MIRLRFVQEYRGRRIVTNGKLYGIEGELVTDCRYLTVAGARAAVDSEVNIAARRKHLESQNQQLADYVAHGGLAAPFIVVDATPLEEMTAPSAKREKER